MDQNIDWVDNPCFKSKGGENRPNKNEVVKDLEDLEKNVNPSNGFAPKTHDRDNRDILGCIPDPNRGNRDFLSTGHDPYKLFDSLTKNCANGPFKRSSQCNVINVRYRKLQNRKTLAGSDTLEEMRYSAEAPHRGLQKTLTNVCARGKARLRIWRGGAKIIRSQTVFLEERTFYAGPYKSLFNVEQVTSPLASNSDNK